jgi:hypothetical protein
MNADLGGGNGGMKHLLEHLGPAMEDWWADLGRIEQTLKARLQTKGCRTEYSSHSTNDMTPVCAKQLPKPLWLFGSANNRYVTICASLNSMGQL